MKRLIVTFACAALHIAAQQPAKAEDNFAIVRSLVEDDRALYRSLQKEWPSVERRLARQTADYRAAERSVQTCNRKLWRGMFKDALEQLEKTRKELEDSRKTLEIMHDDAKTVLDTQNRQLIVLEAAYKNKPREEDYWSKQVTIVGTVKREYYNIVKNKVMVGYTKYGEGISKLSNSYREAAASCNNPTRAILQGVASEILRRVDPIKLISGQILDLIPPKYKSS
ncbi:hypothetical protein M8R20_16525 [Pseudomonas sp. R2.Fl]|nr:hypothetical protein [Pseudomonas sp. R2.Fl]